MFIPSGRVQATHWAREDGHDVYLYCDPKTGTWCKSGDPNGPFQSICRPPANRNRIRGAHQNQEKEMPEN